MGFILKAVVFLSLLQICFGVKCYICQSRSNPACHDPIKTYQLQLTECTPEVMHASSRELGRALHSLGVSSQYMGTDIMGQSPYGYQKTYCQKISFNVGDERVVVRGCQLASGGYQSDSRQSCRQLESQSYNIPGVYLNYCDTCNHDACNSAYVSKTTSLLTLLLLFVLMRLLQ